MYSECSVVHSIQSLQRQPRPRKTRKGKPGRPWLGHSFLNSDHKAFVLKTGPKHPVRFLFQDLSTHNSSRVYSEYSVVHYEALVLHTAEVGTGFLVTSARLRMRRA